VASANGGPAFPGGAVAGGGGTGVVLEAGSAEGKDFAAVADTSGDADDVPPKTLDPVPLPNVASPPVFHAGTESGVVDAA
jgi:hypothetical protein